MFFSKFMLLFIFIPNTEGLEKCLVKENYKLVCHIENENRYSQKVIEVSNLNPDQCQEKCVSNKKCSFYTSYATSARSRKASSMLFFKFDVARTKTFR